MHHALSVLSWHELPEEEQPPEEIWLNPEELDRHWKQIKQDRKDKYSDGNDSVEDAALDENELARSWRNA